MKILERLFRKEPSREDRLRETLAFYQQGFARCDGCKGLIPNARLPPLRLHKCPACGTLFFVAAELEGWVVCQPLATGGEGCVHLACRPHDAREKAAVKLLWRKPTTTEEEVERFLHEAEIGQIFGAHPNLMQVYECGYLEDGAFIITQFVEGPTLDELTDKHRDGLLPELCLYYLLDIVSALEHILQYGYVYRDLNLHNIVVRDPGFAVLLDYGLCLPREEALTRREGKIFGTPLFVPPERCLRMDEDHRSDIYSLGMVFYHILTGRPYFSSQEVEQVIKGHLRHLRAPTSAKMPHADPELVKLVDGMIKQNRDERIASYQDIRSKIGPLLERYQAYPTRDSLLKLRRQHYREWLAATSPNPPTNSAHPRA